MNSEAPADSIKKTYSSTVLLARELIRQPSVTPDDKECQQILTNRLEPIGFHCEQIDREDVTNLWATRDGGGGESLQSPLLVFAGHTDVVPTGPLEQWTIPPFEGYIDGNILHGRGAADMKGSIASFVCACERFVNDYPQHTGSIGLLITSDEEGPALHGTRAVLDQLAQRNQSIDMCIVGEPTSTEKLGDVIKVGRRGSLGARLTIRGLQGHIAYPHLARNPIQLALPALDELAKAAWDQGNENFQPTSLQISNIHSGTGATNVIPGHIDVVFNIRFSPETTEQRLRQQVEQILHRHQLDFEIHWTLSGQPFETNQGQLVEAISDSIFAVTGRHPEKSTSGGTSDGRFIAPTGAQLVELGPINATIHQIDEHISTADLDALGDCYDGVLKRLLAC